MLMTSVLEWLTTNPIFFKEFVMGMISVTTVCTSAYMAALYRYQALKFIATDRAVSSMA